MGPFKGQCKYKILPVGLVFLVLFRYFKMFWPNSTISRPSAPCPSSESAPKSTESPFLLESLSQELVNLTHLLYWPPTPGDEGDLLASSSPQTFTYHPRCPAQVSYTSGGYLKAIFVVQDHQGRPKTHGGDLFQAHLLGADLKAGVPGNVQDLVNGTYLLSSPLL